MLKFQGISKRFGGARALEEVSFEVERASIHAVVGENGAGKSTLMKVAAGVHLPDAGTVLLDGEPVIIASPRHAHGLGIALVPQEPALCPNLSVEENLCLGHHPHRMGVVRRGAMRSHAEAALGRAGLDIAPEALAGRLSSAQRHLLQVARALGQNARVLILDEPTAALSEGETLHLFDRLRRLRDEGVTILYISHRLPEIFALCDTITTLRDGRHIATQAARAVTTEAIVAQMAGRELAAEASELQSVAAPSSPPHDATGNEQAANEQADSAASGAAPLLRVENLGRAGAFGDVSFEVRRGEIVTLAGLVGSGRSEVARCIFGLEPPDAGRLWLEDRPFAPRGPRQAIRAGLALVPEDRRGQGLVMPLVVRENLSLPALAASLAGLSRGGIVRGAAEREAAQRRVSDLSIKTAGIEAGVGTLSGGNAQKVVLGKWLTTAPKLLIVDEPTQGVDVGAKAQVHRLLRQLAGRGCAVLMISSDLPEVLHLSHRILVMRQGRLAGEAPRGASAQDVMHLAALG